MTLRRPLLNIALAAVALLSAVVAKEFLAAALRHPEGQDFLVWLVFGILSAASSAASVWAIFRRPPAAGTSRFLWLALALGLPGAYLLGAFMLNPP